MESFTTKSAAQAPMEANKAPLPKVTAGTQEKDSNRVQSIMVSSRALKLMMSDDAWTLLFSNSLRQFITVSLTKKLNLLNTSPYITYTTYVILWIFQQHQNNHRWLKANAKLRQEEFARLLEEHEQIVNEINRVETKMYTSQTSLQQQQTEEKPW